MAMGRPFGTFIYDNLGDLQAGIDKYFDDCDADKTPYTMYGLALALNIDRGTLLNYSKNDAPQDDQGNTYFSTISRARLRVKNYAERRLFDKDGIGGAKFSLINNARSDGWAERQEVNLDVSPISFVDDLTE